MKSPPASREIIELPPILSRGTYWGMEEVRRLPDRDSEGRLSLPTVPRPVTTPNITRTHP
jgi:hypothetical protein